MKQILIVIFTLFCVNFYAQNQHSEKKSLGLALSGGGAKGYAHIGVLKAFDEENIKVSFIGGTSMGAIVGGLYASGYSGLELEKILKEIDFNDILLNDKKREDLPYFDKTYKEKYILELPLDKDFKLQLPHAISKGQGPANVYSYLLRNWHDLEDFSQLLIPFLCVATELSTGNEKVLKTGYLPQAILASGAFPTLLNPVEIDGKLYTDGGIRNNFPVEHVKNSGVDLVVGVDLGDKLLADSALVSATKVIEQIVRYQVVNNMAEQRKFADLLIKPEVEDYSVVDFEKKNEIIEIGYKAAKKFLTQLPNKESYQYSENEKPKTSVELEQEVEITELIINGLQNYNRSFVKGKLGLEKSKKYSYKKLEQGINKLYSTGYFENIFYRLKSNNESGKTLIINLKEKPNKTSARFAIHYDDLYKTSILGNLTTRHFIFKNSTLSADLILGDNLRYNVNFFVDNGIYPSFGFDSSINQFDSELSPEGLEINEINYEWGELLNRFYVQSTIAERYAIGAGAENQYIEIETDNLLDNNTLQTLENSVYNNFFAFVGADNRNNPNFPTKGFKLNGIIKFLNSPNSEEIRSSAFIDGKFNFSIPLLPFMALKNRVELGTFFNNKAPYSQQFITRGFNEQSFVNTTQFYGYQFGALEGAHKWLIGSEAQFNILNNHYLSLLFNWANFEDEFNDISYLSYENRGYAFKYGYDSPLGPINLIWAYSPNTEKVIFNVALGFWF